MGSLGATQDVTELCLSEDRNLIAAEPYQGDITWIDGYVKSDTSSRSNRYLSSRIHHMQLILHGRSILSSWFREEVGCIFPSLVKTSPRLGFVTPCFLNDSRTSRSFRKGLSAGELETDVGCAAFASGKPIS
jgi:hypothetical protein